jgi:hypothetical protein
MPDSYRRSVKELEQVASIFWPSALAQQEAELSVIPKLLATQDDFISILSVPVASIEGVFAVVSASTLPANLFLKHLVVLADFGGEMLQRLNKQFASLFPDGKLTYFWRVYGETETRVYKFQALPTATLSNSKLGLSGKTLFEVKDMSKLHQDIIALLLLGRASTNTELSNVLTKCEISDYLGQPDKLEKFIRQRYLWVSRITGGAQSNNLGQLAQQFVRTYLEKQLDIADVVYKSNGHLPDVRHSEEADKRETTFDLVVSKAQKHVAIEVSFQVTTNSVIERKAGQAQARYAQIQAKGHKIAYVLDGAGNFQRESALRTICSFSDCTVAFSGAELDVLCRFIRTYFMNG